jgi:acetylornithine/succinyldiaminopimelate/putrescine aminotransferase
VVVFSARTNRALISFAGEIRDLERALELHGPQVAAFLVEPVQGEAG